MLTLKSNMTKALAFSMSEEIIGHVMYRTDQYAAADEMEFNISWTSS